ncbi:MAG: hypothetical protein ACSW8F_06570, partial [bacterium]
SPVPRTRADVGIGPYKGRLQKRNRPVYRTRAADCRPYRRRADACPALAHSRAFPRAAHAGGCGNGSAG